MKYEIFSRLNQGAISLKPQELRNCIYRGSYNQMLEELAENRHLPALFQKTIDIIKQILGDTAFFAVNRDDGKVIERFSDPFTIRLSFRSLFLIITI